MSTKKTTTISSRLLAAAFLLCALGAGTTPALADGTMLSSLAPEIWERHQVAFIQHEDGQEDLRILPSFYGNARDFAWIVPVPAIPTLEIADEQLFYQIEDLTRPHYQHRDAEWGCSEQNYDVAFPGEVAIYQEQLVGMYRTMIIGADNADALVDSLTTWGFLYEENIPYVVPVLESYVDKGWYFATMKVDSTALGEELPYLEHYWHGQMQPIGLTFASEEMIYPLHISALSASAYSDVILYTIADHRMTYPGAETWYANKISASELSAINGIYPFVGAELEVGDFLTRLVRNYSPSEMTDDLVVTRAATDEEFRLVRYSGFPLFSLFLGGSVLGWFGLRVMRQRRQSKTI
jgi:hypothetical protein